MTVQRSTVLCREIQSGDFDALADLMAATFSDRDTELKKLRLLQGRTVPAGVPQLGYLLESGGRPVGLLLAIGSSACLNGETAVRCSLSNWYVEPDYRVYAPMLVSRVLRHKQVTFVNASARPEIWPIIEAQGFRRISNGVFMSFPALSAIRGGSRIVRVRVPADIPHHVGADERTLLLDHAYAGCMALLAITPGGAQPFVLARRHLFRDRFPAAQLIYTRSLDDFVLHSGAIGRYLLRRAITSLLVYSNGPIPGLRGRYFPDRMAKFAKGAHAPRLGDLAYTNIALFGDPDSIAFH